MKGDYDSDYLGQFSMKHKLYTEVNRLKELGTYPAFKRLKEILNENPNDTYITIVTQDIAKQLETQNKIQRLLSARREHAEEKDGQEDWDEEETS